MVILALLLACVPFAWNDPVRGPSAKHPEAVRALALSPDRGRVTSLSGDGQVIVWDVKTQKDVFAFPSVRSAVAMCWLQPGKLITVGAGGLANIDPVAGKVLTLKKIERRTDAGAISPDGRFAVVGNTHFNGALLDVETGNSLKPYPAPAEWSYAMDVSADSSLLAIGGRNPDPDAITLLETKNFTMLRQWPTQLKDAFGLRFAPNGKLLAGVGDSNVVKVWNVADGSLVQSFSLAQPGGVAVCFSPDSKYVAVCCGVPVQQLAPSHSDSSPQQPSPSSKKATSYVQVWNLETKQEVWRSPALTTWGTSIVFAENHRLVTGHQDGTVRFWAVPH